MRHASRSIASRPSAQPTASGTEGVMTWKETSAVKASRGSPASVASCWATRTSLDRVEMPMPTQIDQSASSGMKSSWARSCGAWKIDAADDGGGGEVDTEQDDEVERVGEPDGGDEGGQGLSEQQLGAADGGGQDRFEGSLVALADDRVGGDHRWERDRDDQHQQRDGADRRLDLRPGGRLRHPEDGDHRGDQEEERQHGHRSDHEPVAAKLPHLLANDDPDALQAHAVASMSSSISSR